MKSADKDILDLLAALEFEAEFNHECNEDADEEDVRESSKNVTVFRRIVREAGYKIPDGFEWQKHFQREDG